MGVPPSTVTAQYSTHRHARDLPQDSTCAHAALREAGPERQEASGIPAVAAVTTHHMKNKFSLFPGDSRLTSGFERTPKIDARLTLLGASS